MQCDAQIDVKDLLTKIVRNSFLHARFLNTLSLLEYRGAQKLSRIATSLPSSSFFLEHIAEEYRHAFFLRRLAQKISPSEMFQEYDNVFSKAKTISYMDKIDRRISLMLRDHRLLSKDRAYVFVTLVIEERALPFYRLYQSVLDDETCGISVKSIASEEADHLSVMRAEAKRIHLSEELLASALAFEQKCFSRWLEALDNDIEQLSGCLSC